MMIVIIMISTSVLMMIASVSVSASTIHIIIIAIIISFLAILSVSSSSSSRRRPLVLLNARNTHQELNLLPIRRPGHRRGISTDLAHGVIETVGVVCISAFVDRGRDWRNVRGHHEVVELGACRISLSLFARTHSPARRGLIASFAHDSYRSV